jgi:hypothetical protein
MLIKCFKALISNLLIMVILTACCVGSNSGSSNNQPQSLSLTVSAPSQYPAGLDTPVTVVLTVTNTSQSDISNLHYIVPAPGHAGNNTGVEVTVDANGLNHHCDTVLSGESCTFTATIAPHATPGSFTVTATNSLIMNRINKIANIENIISAVLPNLTQTISATSNLGLVDTPTTNNNYYILPSSAVIQGSSNSDTLLYLSVWVKSSDENLNSLRLVDNSGDDLNYIVLGNESFVAGSVNTYLVTIPANQTSQHIQMLSNTCSTLNDGSNNDSACSNDSNITIAQSPIGILTVLPNYFIMSESHNSQVVTLQNNGLVTIESLLLPTFSSRFSIDNDCGNTLAPKGICNFTIEYAATDSESGVSSYSIGYFNSQDSSSSQITIPYLANSNLGILSANIESITLTPQTSQQTIIFTNSGNAALTLTGLPNLESPLQEQSATCTVDTILQPNQSCSYIVEYTVTAAPNNESLGFEYNNSQATQTKNIPLAYTSKLYAYLLAGNLSNMGQNLLKCLLTESAAFTDCSNLGDFSFPDYNGGVRSITFANVRGTWRAYLANPGQFGFIARCDYDLVSGDVTNCTNVTGSVSGLSAANSVQFHTSHNGTQYGYIAAGGSFSQGVQNGIYKCNVDEAGALNNCAINYLTPSTGMSSANILFQTRNGSDYVYFTNSGEYGDLNNSAVCQLDNDGNVESSSCIQANFPANAQPTYDGYNGWWYMAKQFGDTNYQFVEDNYYGGFYRCSTANDGTYDSCTSVITIDQDTYQYFPNAQFDIVGGIDGQNATYLFYPTQDDSHGIAVFLMSESGSTVSLVHQYTNTDFESINNIEGVSVPQPNAQ